MNVIIVVWTTLIGCGFLSGPPDEVAQTPIVSKGMVRFVALGDGGEGNESQYENADAIAQVCAERGCDFALYLGDNFYDDGVESVDDLQFISKFELPYAELDFPFYAVMGNHDYGGMGVGNEPEKVAYEIAYTAKSDKWRMPNAFYFFDQEHVGFFGLDTNAIMWSWEDRQREWLEVQLPQSRTLWKIAFGHHPYVSNGRHGNAGSYEGLIDFPIISGIDVKNFFDEMICGEVDLYLSGHDHNLQWLHPHCGTEFIVTGAAAKNTDLVGWGTPTFFETDETPGFVWIELDDDQLHGMIFDKSATLLFEQTITKD